VSRPIRAGLHIPICDRLGLASGGLSYLNLRKHGVIRIGGR
jgi:hypothetical protein